MRYFTLQQLCHPDIQNQMFPTLQLPVSESAVALETMGSVQPVPTDPITPQIAGLTPGGPERREETQTVEQAMFVLRGALQETITWKRFLLWGAGSRSADVSISCVQWETFWPACGLKEKIRIHRLEIMNTVHVRQTWRCSCLYRKTEKWLYVTGFCFTNDFLQRNQTVPGSGEPISNKIKNK